MNEYMEKRVIMASIEDEQRQLDALGPSSRHLVAFIYASLVLITGCLLTFGVWLLWPYQTINKTPQPMRIVEGYESVRHGGVVVYQYDYTKYTDVEPTIHRQFVDGLIFESTDTSTHLFHGTGHVHVAVLIPETLPPGVYHLRVMSEFRVNPLRTITAVEETQDFTVLPDPEP